MIKMQKTLTETMKKQMYSFLYFYFFKSHFHSHFFLYRREPSWCFACGAVAKTTCYDNHNTVSIPMDKFTAGYELQKVVTNAKSKLEAVIQKRLELGTELGQILSELKSVEAKIQRKIMENESSLTKAMESLDVLSNKEKCNGNFHAIKEKMEKSIQDSDTQLKILTDLSAERQLERKIRMKIHLESGDQKIRTVPLFEDGFCLEDSNTTPNMAVISYLFISDLKRRNISLKISEENSYSNESI